MREWALFICSSAAHFRDKSRLIDYLWKEFVHALSTPVFYSFHLMECLLNHLALGVDQPRILYPANSMLQKK
jgi:hypothetical protein